MKKKDVTSVCSLIGIWFLLFCLVITASGCAVIMNAQYTDLLNRTTALSAATAERAEEDKLSKEEMTKALRLQANVWQRFKDAREGKE
jgi:apolipoprotein N-acyltransferase